jgi:hypothetical protein
MKATWHARLTQIVTNILTLHRIASTRDWLADEKASLGHSEPLEWASGSWSHPLHDLLGDSTLDSRSRSRRETEAD